MYKYTSILVEQTIVEKCLVWVGWGGGGGGGGGHQRHPFYHSMTIICLPSDFLRRLSCKLKSYLFHNIEYLTFQFQENFQLFLFVENPPDFLRWTVILTLLVIVPRCAISWGGKRQILGLAPVQNSKKSTFQYTRIPRTGRSKTCGFYTCKTPKKLFEQDFVNGLHGLAQYNCTIWSGGREEKKKALVLKSDSAQFPLLLLLVL